MVLAFVVQLQRGHILMIMSLESRLCTISCLDTLVTVSKTFQKHSIWNFFLIKDTKKIVTSLHKAGKIVRVPFRQHFDKFTHFCFSLTEILQL